MGKSAAQMIDGRIAELGDWRGAMLARVRRVIRAADPEIVEAWKWRGVPVWEREGMICTGETHQRVVKMTFANGAELADPAGLFNASLDGNVRRAIDVREGDDLDERALTALVRAAISRNVAKRAAKAKPAAKPKPKPAAKTKAKPSAKAKPAAKPKLSPPRSARSRPPAPRSPRRAR